jgi:hippurate hydrolase
VSKNVTDALALADQGLRRSDDLVALRRRLHRIPEVGLHLPQTQSAILAELEGLGLEITLGDRITSVTAVLRGGGPGDTVLLRSDMDGLPIRERSGLAWASTNGAMHACGHDLHMSGLVGAARILAENRDRLHGDVVFVFQPGEEGHGGGRIMVEDGVLAASGTLPVACFAIHVLPTGPAGAFRTKAGAVMAGMNELRVTVRGVGGHASAPHELRDPVPVIAEITLALQTLVTRRFDVADPVVITVTQLSSASEAVNVVPASASLAASVRTLSAASLETLKVEVPRLANGIAAAHGCAAEIEIVELYPVTVNDAAETAFAVDALGAAFGGQRVDVMTSPMMASEDFSYLLDAAPGAFLLMNATPDAVGPENAQTLHSDSVVFDDSLLGDHAVALATLALERLAGAR